MYSDRLALNGGVGRKRSVKDRLGDTVQNGDDQSRSSKRFQGSDGKWHHDMYDDTNKTRLSAKSDPINTQDLRFKLQKNGLRGAQGGMNGSGGIKDLREKLSGPVPPPRTPAVTVPQHGSSSAVRVTSSAVTNAPVVKHSAASAKPPAPAAKPSATIVKPSATAVKPSVPAVKPSSASRVSAGAAVLTIASFLQSLDLSKYLITFQAEEIDMSILRVMKEEELKELGIPMGPRKKISLALAAQSKH
ncbi:hypothetical protein GOP47_0006196 [Adiantum capillus-veneris]|uniref:SAM domain-containing protein n=1 Tax=Adiantum capillus-veneris TaxID=13818 RepID=A0A9D4V2E1_ADICA|nr:hypothetical protein GOP47_0006196 [Adiantum capillus-veneris]